LNRRISHRSPHTTSCVMDALSASMNANGRQPVAIATTWPMVPPWVNTATRRSVCAAAMRVTDSRMRALKSSVDSPPLLGEHPHRDRVLLRDPDAEQPALPLAEVDLTHARLHDRRDPQPLRERLRGLVGAAQRGHVDAVEHLVFQAVRDLLGLLLADLGQRRVALAVDLGERPVLAGGLGLAVPDEQDLRRARREGEAELAVLL
jgi:hypothetical protein